MKVKLAFENHKLDILISAKAMTLARLFNVIDENKLAAGEARKEFAELKDNIHTVLEEEGFYTTLTDNLDEVAEKLIDNLEFNAFSSSKDKLAFIANNKSFNVYRTDKDNFAIYVNGLFAKNVVAVTVWELKNEIEKLV